MKEEALKLAEDLLDRLDSPRAIIRTEASAMIRRLVEELDKQTKPLSDEEIDKIIYSVDWAYDPVLLARTIEERHGIK